ncbi:type II toxin-antitoxin system RelE/ParE family toxin [Candidatus Peregrinibacteria bacterium]|nr:type II toxin-antitoxin system RelE/ParE family toxin [Candidatus Peregrinibacteria bacterium]
MIFEIKYAEKVVKEEIPKLPKIPREQIQKDIEKKLTTMPEIFGKPLRKSLKGYRRLRIGDYRVIFRIEKNTVKIFKIGHRSTIYNDLILKMFNS